MPIVVGVDASEGAQRALRWAAEEARLRGEPLEAVHVVPPRDVPEYHAELPLPSRDDAELEARDLLHEQLRRAGLDPTRVLCTVRAGDNPVAVLCETARDADLLVVGARGRGGFAGLLLGSVSQQVVTHAPCPVVVVVPEQE